MQHSTSRSFRDPAIPDGEETRYLGSVDGKELGSGTIAVSHSARGYLQRTDARLGAHGSFDLEMEFAREEGRLLAESYRLDTFWRDRLASREEGFFREVEVLHFGGKMGVYPTSVTPLLGCAIALRGLDFSGREKRSLALWLANTVHWELGAHVEKAETIEVEAGRFDAWRVRVRPRFDAVNKQLDGLVGFFLPPFLLHFDQKAPHRMLRFEFPTGPFPWNPRALVQAVELIR